MLEGAAEGWRSPIRELVVKLHERCNLACRYCYMYEAADQSWRSRPKMMARDTVTRVARRLGEHAQTHDLEEVRIVFHGGEPLLIGLEELDFAVGAFREAVVAGTRVSFAIQTNALLLDDRFLQLFLRHNIRVGVSVDGDRAANDRHRRHADGRSSYDAVVRGIGLLSRPAYREIYGGLLCTVDLHNDPVDTYSSLLRHQPPLVDFLLPHGNWAFPPPGITGRRPGNTSTDTPYADWLIAIFDRWYDAPQRETGIRLFDSVIALLLGGTSDTEAIGLGIPTSVVVETDGSIEGNDALKTTGPTGGATGLTVFAHSFDDVLSDASVAGARQGFAGLGPTCQSCQIVSVCGGGLHAHRFSSTEGFSRPSVFCPDLYHLVRHIRARLETDLRSRMRTPSGIAVS
jgi:uncharacterized protein